MLHQGYSSPGDYLTSGSDPSGPGGAALFWYRNRVRKDYYVQGWKPRRIYAGSIVTLRGDDDGEDDDFHEVFVVETKGVHLKAPEDTRIQAVRVRHLQRARPQG